jgi:hypothetical protein
MRNTHAFCEPGRTLILVDIENLTATPSPTSQQVETVVASLRLVVSEFDRHQKIVACSHHAAPVVAFTFPSAGLRWRSGPDGADLALLDVIEYERVDARFEQVIICSGDGIFSGAAGWLASRGVAVTVISLPGHLAARLELAAREVRYLPELSTCPPTLIAS